MYHSLNLVTPETLVFFGEALAHLGANRRGGSHQPRSAGANEKSYVRRRLTLFSAGPELRADSLPLSISRTTGPILMWKTTFDAL